jgi:hypothetical protein
MNLHVQSGLARSCSALDAFSISFGFLLPQPTAVSDCRFQFNPASSCLPGTAFPIPCKVTNWLESRPVQSVDTSAKRDETCGFHHFWCINRSVREDFVQFDLPQRPKVESPRDLNA